MSEHEKVLKYAADWRAEMRQTTEAIHTKFDRIDRNLRVAQWLPALAMVTFAIGLLAASLLH